MEDLNNCLDSEGADEEIGSDKDQKLESTKEEIGEVREENERLKFLLDRLMNDYQEMQTNLFDILQQNKQEEAKDKAISTSQEENEGSDELVSLSLGITCKDQLPTIDEKKNSTRSEKREDEDVDKGLALGLDVRFDPLAQFDEVYATNDPSPESSFDEEGKEAEPSEMWPPSKVLKTMKIEDTKSDKASQHTQLKKTRVSIRARCDTQTMNDGCQWRKYGQKMAKGNPCPRAYYRCTVSPSCPVRKQVQRCAEDMSILITTYEGTHNHPLPVSATAIASTTSAAASVLQSPSLITSQQALTINNSDLAPIINNSSATYYNSNSLNFSTYQIPKPHQFYFPNSSISTLNSHPTITLDLTSPTNIPKFSSTNLNFSSTFFPLQYSSMSQSPWSNHSGYFNSLTLPQNRNQLLPYQGNHIHQPIYMSNHNISQQSSLPDSIVAATKAITTNPKFQSVLASSLTTYVGNGGGGGELSRYMNVPSSALSSQQGNSIMFSPPMPVSKSASDSSHQGSLNERLT